MSDSALRSRVERLISGEFRPEDLMRLFLSLRDRSYGREAVREIGDFVAHADEKTKGITTQSVRDFFTSARFRLPNLQTKTDLSHLPLNFPDILRASFRQLSADIIRKDTGLRRKSAGKILDRVIATIRPTGSGELSISGVPDESSFRLIQCLTSYIVSKPAFSEDRLFDEFCGALNANKLMITSERRAFQSLKGVISLFAACQMHQCKIDLGDSTKGDLRLTLDCGSGTLGVMASAEIPNTNPTGKVLVASPIYVTSLQAEYCCEQTLLADAAVGSWECAIEITSHRTFTKLG